MAGAADEKAGGAPRPCLVLITGLSGSGKSSVAKAFEDLGYYTVDNLPLPLLEIFLADPFALVPSHTSIAVVTDVRAPGFYEDFPRLVRELPRERVDITLLFLEAPDETLVRRFSETRRPHPLAADQPVIEGIRRERELLAELRGQADRVLDTGAWTIHEVRHHIYREFARDPESGPGMVVSLTSFGYKHGIPAGSDMLFDLRFLPNPHFVPGLRERTGREPEVRRFLEDEPEYREVLGRLRDLLLDLLPRFRREGRSYLAVAVGCTGGRHRSVAACERLATDLRAADWPVKLIHRDLER